MEEILRSGKITTISGEARLMKWILELESADFPEVLERLEGIEGMEGAADDPFAADSAGSDLVMLALSRWYELDGERVLEWVMEENEAHEAKKKITSLIKDGYARDPEASFRALEKHARLLTGENGLSSSWCFEVARWSQDLGADLASLNELFTTYGTNRPSQDDPPDDPFASDEELGAEYYLARGAIAAGREDELRAVLGDQHPEVLRELEALENQKAVDIASQEGWQALRDGVDQGRFENEFWIAEKVYENWAKENPEQAEAWFLKQDLGNREMQIVRMVGLELPSWANGSDGSLDFESVEVAERIQEFASQGEPVEEAWAALAAAVVEGDHWDEVEALKSAVPAAVWEGMTERIRSDAVSHRRLALGSDASVWFREISQEELKVLERFGLKERALQEIADTNEESLRKLHEWLGVE